MWTIFEAIVLLILSSGMGVVCGLTSYFLDYTFWPGSINQWYLPWLAKWVLRDEANIDVLIKLGPDSYMPFAEKKFWFKILGGCAVCFNIWLALISWTIICLWPGSIFTWYYGFAYIMVSSAVIRNRMGVQ